MPFNGSGTFTRNTGSNTGTDAWNQDNLDGINIITANHDTHDQDIANGLSNCVTRDGQGKMGADFAPSTDDARDLGTASLTWRNINAKGTLNLLDGVNDGARFYNASNYVELRAPSTLAANRVFTLPNTLGSAGQFLTVDGSGNTSWATGSGAYNRISTTVLSGSSINIAADGATFKVFDLIFDQAATNAGDTLRLQVSVDNTATFQGTAGKTIIGNGVAPTSTSPSPVDFVTLTSGAGNEAFGTVRIFVNGSSASQQVRFMANFIDSSFNVNIANGRFTNNTGTLTHIKILSGSGNTLSGTVRLYGISN